MARIVFYEKPGCAGNARQRAWLVQAGHVLQPRDLLAQAWTAAELWRFLGALPVAEWFNRAAPRIKCGEIDPDRLDRDQALCLLVADPLLIRRPLMRRDDGSCLVGFDAAEVDAWVGLAHPDDLPRRTEGCIGSAKSCPDPTAAAHRSAPIHHQES